jgi:poly(3-hydroxybutyrate) depolymerase
MSYPSSIKSARGRRHALAFATIAIIAAIGCSTGTVTEPYAPSETGQFVIDDTPATAQRPVTAWYHKPAGLSPDAPILIVLHGMGRNARGYRDAWIGLADHHDFLIVTPEFTSEHWPGSRAYNLGNMFEEDGTPIDERYWSFSVIEDLFDRVRGRFDMAGSTYTLYGHSAGAQFAHRFALFIPDTRAEALVTANAGWYTMPVDTVSYPYGLRFDDGEVIASDERIRDALRRPVIVLLGEEDNDPDHHQLRRTQGAMAQGDHRFERGHTFFETARDRAAELDADFDWTLETVPGVGHSNARMAPGAVRALGW